MKRVFRCLRARARSVERRAAVIAWTAISVTMLLGFAALAVDVGYLQLVRTELQNAADSAALAGVSAFTSSTQFTRTFDRDSLTTLAVSRTQDYAAKNYADGKALTIAASDIHVGYLAHPESLADTITTAVYPYNAVRCTVTKSSADGNGPVGTFFGNIWGVQSAALAATATAVLDTRLGGYKPGSDGGPLIPITIDQTTWTDLITNGNGPDTYHFDHQTGQVTATPDGVPEINIYPENQKNNPGGTNPDGAGNFGLLNFENGNNSVNPVGEQIEHGLAVADVQRTIGTDTFTFYKEIVGPNNTVTGTPITYAIDGTPGLKASLQTAFNSRVGKVVGIFINDQVAGTGSNCVYTITGIQYGILLTADLNGGNKAVIIQPTVYVGKENIIVSGAPTVQTGGRIVLAR